MKSKLTLSIDSDLMENINQKAKLDKTINLSKMVEGYLQQAFQVTEKKKASISSLKGILKETEELNNWKQAKTNRLTKKYL
ncbi:MAG: hypothetical protein H7101_05950 [Deinococcales bacterium]|nr:hypothetical protein [Chitinophagaceae bacterium]